MKKNKLFVAYAAYDKEKGMMWGNMTLNGVIKTDNDIETARAEILRANKFDTVVIINWQQVEEAKK